MHAFLEDAVKIADISESAVARNLADRLLCGKQQPAALGNPQVIDICHGGNMHNRLKEAAESALTHMKLARQFRDFEILTEMSIHVCEDLFHSADTVIRRGIRFSAVLFCRTVISLPDFQKFRF